MPRVVSVQPSWLASYSTEFGEPYRVTGRDYVTSRTNMLWQRRAVQRASSRAVAAGEFAPIVGLGLDAAKVAAGLGGRVVKRIKGSINRKPQSKFKQIDFGAGPEMVPMKRRASTHGMRLRGSAKRPRHYRIGDPSSYRQLTSVKRKFGRKLRMITRNMRLLKTVVEPIRFRFGRVQDINAATGSYWLSNQPLDVNQRVLPMYIMPLFNIRNPGSASGNTGQAGRAMYELAHDTNGFFFRVVNGTNPLSTGTITNSVQAVQPTNTAADQVGRKGLCDWTRIRLCFWGKTQNPTNIRVSMVKFLDEEFCPESYDTRSTGLTTNYTQPKFTEWLTNKVKYLLNGHMGAYGRVDRGRYVKVLKQWSINMNPIDAAAETAASDPRPHMKHLDIFNRWNRVCDYTIREGQAQSYVDMIDVNKANTATTGFGGYLKNPEKGVYLIVESVQPVECAVANAANPRAPPAVGEQPLTASFDYLFESNFTVVKE